MFFYDYACSGCDAKITKRRRVAERDAPLACEQCGGAMNRTINRQTGGFVLGEGGCGWAKEGYAGKPPESSPEGTAG